MLSRIGKILILATLTTLNSGPAFASPPLGFGDFSSIGTGIPITSDTTQTTVASDPITDVGFTTEGGFTQRIITSPETSYVHTIISEPTSPSDYEPIPVFTIPLKPGFYPEAGINFSNPEFPGIPSETPTAFAYLPSSESLLILDTKSDTILGKLTTPYVINSIAPDPLNLRSVVTHSNANRVSIFDPLRLTYVRTVEVGALPQHAAISMRKKLRGYAFVAVGNSNTLSVVDLYSESNPIAQKLKVFAFPHRVVASPSADKIYVLNMAGGVSVLSAASDDWSILSEAILIDLPLQDGEVTRDMVISPDGTRLFVTATAKNHVDEIQLFVIDTTTDTLVNLDNSSDAKNRLYLVGSGQLAFEGTALGSKVNYTNNKLGNNTIVDFLADHTKKYSIFSPGTAETMYNLQIENYSDGSILQTIDLPSNTMLAGHIMGPVLETKKIDVYSDSVDFNKNAKNSKSTIAINVINSSTLPNQINKATITGDDAAAFTIARNECQYYTLNPEDHCVLEVQFNGSDTRHYSAQLNLTDASSVGDVVINLDGSFESSSVPEESKTKFGLIDPLALLLLLTPGFIRHAQAKYRRRTQVTQTRLLFSSM